MDTPYSHDLRAASIEAKRARTRAEKYYSFRGVKPGQLHQPHYRLVNEQHQLRLTDWGFYLSQSTFSNDTPIAYFTPRILFKEAQEWPRPPTYHHRHTDKLDKRGVTHEYERRRMQQRDTRKMINRMAGPGEEWRDDEEGLWHGNSASTCAMCMAEQNCIDAEEDEYELAALWEEGEVAEILRSRQEDEGESLMAAAVEKRERQHEENMEADGWSSFSIPDEQSDFDVECDDSESEWMMLGT